MIVGNIENQASVFILAIVARYMELRCAFYELR
jgi:hypothetical protein